MNKLILSLMNINAIFTDWRRITENKRVYLTKWLVSRLLIAHSTTVLHLVSNDCYDNEL